MNIAIFGYGKMGKKIEEHAQKKGHKILVKSNSKNPAKKSNLLNVDVIIDFPSIVLEVFANNNDFRGRPT